MIITQQLLINVEHNLNLYAYCYGQLAETLKSARKNEIVTPIVHQSYTWAWEIRYQAHIVRNGEIRYRAQIVRNANGKGIEIVTYYQRLLPIDNHEPSRSTNSLKSTNNP